MKINEPIKITNAVTLSDGGTKYLIGYDNKENEFSFLIAQHIFPDNFNSTLVPGRLHFNQKPIKIRSKIEREIIKSLERCSIKIDSTELVFSKGLKEIKGCRNLMEANEKGQAHGVVYLVKYIIDYVQSDKYIEIAEKFKPN